jgi:hypothetical protein
MDNPGEYRDFKLALADLIDVCIHDLDCMLESEGFELFPYNVNKLQHIKRADELTEGDGDAEKASDPLLPGLSRVFRPGPESDSRHLPNIYLETMPLRCHCELLLAAIRLDLGDLEIGRRLLQEAEARMARCVHFMPYLYVQFCCLKLKWRRLDLKTRRIALAMAPPSDNKINYNGPNAFVDGVCPTPVSPVFRTFLKKARSPSLTADTAWLNMQVKKEALDTFLKELLDVVRVAVVEGGHDYSQLIWLLMEGLCEIVDTHVTSRQDPDESAFKPMYVFFLAIVTVSELKRALHFTVGDNASGAGKGAPVDATQLPQQIALDIKMHLERQMFEGALAYSENAVLETTKTIGFQTVVKHLFALRKECDIFHSTTHAERVLCDQLHVAMINLSPVYKQSKVIDDTLMKNLETPPDVPKEGNIMFFWAQADPGSSEALSIQATTTLMAFICPLQEDEDAPLPLVLQINGVRKQELRKLFDDLHVDLDHSRPAVGVATDYVEGRLRELVRILKGKGHEENSDTPDAVVDGAVDKLLRSLAFDDPDAAAPEDPNALPPLPEKVEAKKVGALLRSLVRLLDLGAVAARNTHPELNRFLRRSLGPFGLFPTTIAGS